MINYRIHLALFSTSLLCIIWLSCDSDSTSSGNKTFPVKIVDEAQTPVSGALIRGGFDWDAFSEITDRYGIAHIPEYGLNARATIAGDNYFSSIVNNLTSARYTIKATPFELAKIGDIDGDAIKFMPGRIITLSYQGKYHVYNYDDYGVSEMATDSFPPSMKIFRMFGDTLWYTTHNDGIYVYLLTDPLHPQRLLHLNIPGYLWPFDRRDSLVVVGDFWQPGLIRMFRYDLNGSIDSLSSLGSFIISDMKFISNYLIAVDGTLGTPDIFDIGDPSRIILINSGYYDTFGDGFFKGDSLILRASGGNGFNGTHNYITLDLSSPAAPVTVNSFSAPGTIADIVQDSIAVGTYYFDYYAQAVFRRQDAGNFEVAAMVLSTSIPEFQGSFPPYYIFTSHLYKLMPRRNR